MRSTIHVLFCLAFLGWLWPMTSKAQNDFHFPYQFQHLSHVANAGQKDSLKKHWTCPQAFAKKETQKKYAEIWEGRTAFVVGAMAGRHYVQEPQLLAYLQGIVDELVAANKQWIPRRPTVLLDRSPVVNAYAFGGNMLAVNAGLVAFARSREDLAMVIAHELAHNALEHSDYAIKEKADWLTSDAYKTSLESVLDSKYERLTRLKKITENYQFSRNRHNRYKESEADSLGMIMMANAKLKFDAGFFLKLDSSDLPFREPLAKPLNTYFAALQLPFETLWTQRRSKGLSTRSYNFETNTSQVADSLKTHPDCVVRYERYKAVGNASPGQMKAVPAALQMKAREIIVWNMFDDMNLGACFYTVLREKDKGGNDAWCNFMLHNIVAGLHYNDGRLNRFKAIGIVPKEQISKDYYELQNLLEQMPREQLQASYEQLRKAAFWNQLPPDAKALRELMHQIAQAEASDKEKERAAEAFMTAHPQSMLGEFAQHFRK